MKPLPVALVAIASILLAVTVGGQRAPGEKFDFIFPRENQVIAGERVLLWVSSPVMDNPVRRRDLVFELSLDGEHFQTLPQSNAPDLGPASHTTTLDTRLLPVGIVFLRARLVDPDVVRTIRVRVGRLPEPQCRVMPESKQKGLVRFDCTRSSDMDGRITSYRWKFGDGSSSTTTTGLISHRYNQEGRFPFELTVTDDDGFTATLLRDLVHLAGLFMMDDRKQCGCDEMTVTATGKSVLGDFRRKKNDAFEPVPLGFDPDYMSFNFEVSAALSEDSDPNLCSEGQEAKGTFTQGKFVSHKHACTAGRDLPHCSQNSSCDTHTCRGGFKNGKSCDSFEAAFGCNLGGGVCRANNDGVCTEYPVNGPKRGDDDYRVDYSKGEGPKIHCPSCDAPTWVDAPGFPDLEQVYANSNMKFELDFLSFVKGNSTCQCHFRVLVDWDAAKKKLTAASGITLVKDGETVKCKLVK